MSTSTNTWTKRHLTWALHLGGIPSGMRIEAVERAVWDAFDAWQHAGVFHFTPTDPADTRSDIHIKFAEPPTAHRTHTAAPSGGITWRRGAFHSTPHTRRLGLGYPPWSPHWRGFLYLDPEASWTLNYWALTRHYLPAVLLHEIGHVLGLSHASTGVMRDGYDRNTKVTGADLEKLRATYQHIDQYRA